LNATRKRGRVSLLNGPLSIGSRNLLLHQLRSGDCVRAVTNITDFYALCGPGGIEGLVHVSEISWGRVRHPRMVEARRTDPRLCDQVEQDRSRVALSMKRLRPNPWETAEERYHVDQITEAVITSVVPFGAFARLEEGLDGLIHVSEMGLENDSASPIDALYEGQKVLVRVLHVDAFKQRLGLSLQVDS
jgi:small subunit ribosomal protein S1